MFDSIRLSDDQQKAHDEIVAWYARGSSPLLTMGGFAGTGKTTTISKVVDHLSRGGLGKRKKKKPRRPRIGFCCYTGKASLVLRGKLEEVGGLRSDDTCSTIHGLIYEAIKEEGVIVGWRKKKPKDLDCELIVLDEASMVDATLFEDLQSYGFPILAVGDHGQLPPISGKLNLMADPQVKLQRIHRQAEGSPIIKLSMMIRNGEHIAPGSYGEWVNKVNDQRVLDKVPDQDDMMVIVGINRTRTRLNQEIRHRLGFNDVEPMVGEKVICLRNNHKKEIFNGMLGKLLAIEPYKEHWYKAKIALGGLDDAVFEDLIVRRQFGSAKTLNVAGPAPDEELKLALTRGDLWDWGYSMTCHKAQGSQARRVVVFEENSWMETEDLRRRWFYTAVTRAQERLLIIGR